MIGKRWFRLRSGDSVRVRPLRRSDAPALGRAVEQLSDQSRYRRFHSASPLSEKMLHHLTNIDHHDHEAFIALAPGSEIVGVARCIRDPEAAETAELAILVVDGWQRRGLGTLLVGELAARAAELGISQFTADILAENAPTLALAHSLGETQLTQRGTTVAARIDNTSARPEEELKARTVLRGRGRAERCPGCPISKSGARKPEVLCTRGRSSGRRFPRPQPRPRRYRLSTSSRCKYGRRPATAVSTRR